MQVTFILRNLSAAFYEGNNSSIIGLLQEPTNLARFNRLQTSTAKDLGITIKIGHSNAFRDRVELNQLLRKNPEPDFKLEPRRGYRLATFEFKP